MESFLSFVMIGFGLGLGVYIFLRVVGLISGSASMAGTAMRMRRILRKEFNIQTGTPIWPDDETSIVFPCLVAESYLRSSLTAISNRLQHNVKIDPQTDRTYPVLIVSLAKPSLRHDPLPADLFRKVGIVSQ